MSLFDLPILSWIRDAFGIRKDIIDTEKSKLEVKKLKRDEEACQNVISEPTLEEILQYDTKRLKLTKKALKEQLKEIDRWKYWMYPVKGIIIKIMLAEIEGELIRRRQMK